MFPSSRQNLMEILQIFGAANWQNFYKFSWESLIRTQFEKYTEFAENWAVVAWGLIMQSTALTPYWRCAVRIPAPPYMYIQWTNCAHYCAPFVRVYMVYGGGGLNGGGYAIYAVYMTNELSPRLSMYGIYGSTPALSKYRIWCTCHGNKYPRNSSGV
jgi:hypothetical protein